MCAIRCGISHSLSRTADKKPQPQQEPTAATYPGKTTKEMQKPEDLPKAAHGLTKAPQELPKPPIKPPPTLKELPRGGTGSPEPAKALPATTAALPGAQEDKKKPPASLSQAAENQPKVLQEDQQKTPEQSPQAGKGQPKSPQEGQEKALDKPSQAAQGQPKALRKELQKAQEKAPQSGKDQLEVPQKDLQKAPEQPPQAGKDQPKVLQEDREKEPEKPPQAARAQLKSPQEDQEKAQEKPPKTGKAEPGNEVCLRVFLLWNAFDIVVTFVCDIALYYLVKSVNEEDYETTTEGVTTIQPSFPRKVMAFTQVLVLVMIKQYSDQQPPLVQGGSDHESSNISHMSTSQIAAWKAAYTTRRSTLHSIQERTLEMQAKGIGEAALTSRSIVTTPPSVTKHEAGSSP
ncbi:hypothetical protein HPB50_015198 [Hyalomma asiaticum]|uniref:Uncharacterized protein n=1 Tax=Hyalomma asiaticum TaxID=266040 RepID=A0ACB7SN26_HYAAI|nr:hypothetical protein HPB50_015198 [Hyalomma asiaticum]